MQDAGLRTQYSRLGEPGYPELPAAEPGYPEFPAAVPGNQDFDSWPASDTLKR